MQVKSFEAVACFTIFINLKKNDLKNKTLFDSNSCLFAKIVFNRINNIEAGKSFSV